MSELTSTQEALRALRQAAADGDVNGCWNATHELLRRLPARRALQAARDIVAHRLPVFERHQPEVRWPREFIESAVESGSADDGRAWPETEDDFPGPGANNFTNAVEALWKAGHVMKDAHRLSELLADAMGGAIIAERLEYWGARHPDAWARWYQSASSGSDDMSRFEVLATIKRDPEAARVEREAWLEVARRLEEELNAAASSSQ
jgi:hypothetical protein